ncbi:apolipoprotein C-I [Elgaria multicarinata webbii]|uniref:apolipoprotein C-I n=1 Tax=Elgaria multicarinata webbii TaxID=159646 RepID=UPI002FCD660B
MQLAVSIAVVLVALSVVTGTQDVTVTEPTLSQKFEKVQQDFQNFANRIGERTKTAFNDLHHSEFSNRTRNWFAENFQKMKEKFRAITNRESD